MSSCIIQITVEDCHNFGVTSHEAVVVHFEDATSLLKVLGRYINTIWSCILSFCGNCFCCHCRRIVIEFDSSLVGIVRSQFLPHKGRSLPLEMWIGNLGNGTFIFTWKVNIYTFFSSLIGLCL